MRKSLLIVLLALSLPLAWLLWPLSDASFAIEENPEMLAAKASFLNQPLARDSAAPNILLILADDLGKTDISLYGSPHVQTPNLDGIGREGVVFDEGYVTSPICSPSRAGMITGRYQQRFGYEYQPHDRYPKNRLEYYVFDWFIDTEEWDVADQSAFPREEDKLEQGLPRSEVTLSEILQQQGYATAAIGKWHLGNNAQCWPLERGFDYHYGFLEAHSLYAADTSDPDIENQRHTDFSDPYIWGRGREGHCAIRRNNEEIRDSMFLTTRIQLEAQDFIRQHKNEPFFLYVPFLTPHTPFQITQDYYDQFAHVEDRNKRIYYAMIKSLDDAVGEILGTLEAEGLAQNTLVIFLSDNGGAAYTHATDNAPLKGGKFTHFEGGLNVPFMMRWPEKLPAGKRFAPPISSLDIFATVTELTGAPHPKDRTYDGTDLLPFLMDSVRGNPHEALYWRSDYSKAIRRGDWKLIWDELGGETALYRLNTDKIEQVDVHAQYPDTVAALKKIYANWESQMQAPKWPRVMDYHYPDGDRTFNFPL